jgi:hypothetical protein
MLAFWRSPPVAIAFMKTIVIEALDHGASLGRRQVGDRRAQFIHHDQWWRSESGCHRGFVLATSL